jgi:hypothetical protein
VASCCECSDEPSESSAKQLVSRLISCTLVPSNLSLDEGK